MYIKNKIKSQGTILRGKRALLHQSTDAAVVCNKKRNPVSPWFPGPQSCILTHLLHSTTGNEITRSPRVCAAGQGRAAAAPAPTTQLPLPQSLCPRPAGARIFPWFVWCCPLFFPLDVLSCCSSPGGKQILVWCTDFIWRAWVMSNGW